VTDFFLFFWTGSPLGTVERAFFWGNTALAYLTSPHFASIFFLQPKFFFRRLAPSRWNLDLLPYCRSALERRQRSR
jgi:hypothetical protein